jgi:hypothetical protein
MTEAVTNKPWNGSPSRFTDEQYRRSCVIKGPAPYKQNCHLPVREPDGTLNCRAVSAAKGRLNQVKGSTAGARAKLDRLSGICERTRSSSDSHAQMAELATIAKALGLDEKASEEDVLAALGKTVSLKDLGETLGIEIAEDAEPDKVLEDAKAKLEEKPAEQSLEDRAKAEGKKLVDADEFAETKRKAEAGERAEKELRQQKFDTAFEKALDEGRVDAKDETKERLQKLYDADAEACLEDLDNRPKIVNTEARGSGKSRDAGEAPEGVDQESFELDQRVKAYMDEHDEPDYDKALDKVMREKVPA